MNKLTRELRRLHDRAGRPSYRRIADLSDGLISHAAVRDALQGIRFPRWSTVRAVAVAMRATDDEVWALRDIHSALREEEAA